MDIIFTPQNAPPPVGNYTVASSPGATAVHIETFDFSKSPFWNFRTQDGFPGNVEVKMVNGYQTVEFTGVKVKEYYNLSPEMIISGTLTCP